MRTTSRFHILLLISFLYSFVQVSAQRNIEFDYWTKRSETTGPSGKCQLLSAVTTDNGDVYKRSEYHYGENGQLVSGSSVHYSSDHILEDSTFYDYFQVGSDSVVLSRSFSTHYSDTMKVVRKFGRQGLKEQLTYYLDGDIWRMHNHVFYDDMGHVIMDSIFYGPGPSAIIAKQYFYDENRYCGSTVIRYDSITGKQPGRYCSEKKVIEYRNNGRSAIGTIYAYDSACDSLTLYATATYKLGRENRIIKLTSDYSSYGTIYRFRYDLHGYLKKLVEYHVTGDKDVYRQKRTKYRYRHGLVTQEATLVFNLNSYEFVRTKYDFKNRIPLERHETYSVQHNPVARLLGRPIGHADGTMRNDIVTTWNYQIIQQ